MLFDTLQFKVLEKDDQFLFDCGDPDMNEYFHKDAMLQKEHLIGVTYCFFDKQNRVAVFFTVNNDSLKLDPDFRNQQPDRKRYSSYPAVKIGRLGVDLLFQKQGVGSSCLNVLKYLFTYENKTACRFLLVDAYNKPEIRQFYYKNGFTLSRKKDEDNYTKKTVSLKYDLYPYRNAINRECSIKSQALCFSSR